MRHLDPALFTAILGLVLLLAALPSPAAEQDLDALLDAARTEETEYEFRRAERIYRQVLAADEGNFEALMGLGRAASAVGEHPPAEAHYLRAAEVAPESPDPLRGMGNLAVRLDRRDEARKWFMRGLAVDPDDAGSMVGLARIEIENGNFAQADGLLTRAEELDPGSTTVLSGRSEYLFRTKDMDGAARLLRRIIEKSPLHLGANQRLANGFIEADRLPPPPPPEVSPAYGIQVQSGADLYRDTLLDRAEELFEPMAAGAPQDGRPDFYLGLIDLRRGQPREALAHLRSAVAREPENQRFRNALSVSLKQLLASQRAEYGGGDDPANRLGSLAALQRTAEVEGIESLVPAYFSLLPNEREVINRAARPFAHYLYFLRRQGVTHDILGFEEGMCDAPSRRYLNQQRTHDNRWYGAIRGIGGQSAATGIEAVLEAAEWRYDTFAHELAHQVHQYGFSEQQQRVVTELYRRAMLTDRCLDYYAATNEREYLAQGYEAFVSPAKSPFHHHLRRHTRAELRARDPGLYRFLMRVTKTPELDPQLLPLAAPILSFYQWSGDSLALHRVEDFLSTYTMPSPIPR